MKPATGGNVFFDFLKLNRNTKKSFVCYCFFVLSLYFLKMKTFADFLNWTRSAEICRFSKIAKNAKSHHPTLPYSVCTYIFRHCSSKKKLCSSWGEHFSIRFKTRRDLDIFYMFSHFFSPVGEWGSKHLKTTLRIKCTQKSA